MGRNANPIQLVKARGRKHLTKKEIDIRLKNEIKTGINELICPDFIKEDKIAYEKWLEIVEIYKDAKYVSSGDIGLISRYCMTYSEYLELINYRSGFRKIDIDWSDYGSLLPTDFKKGIEGILDMDISYKINNMINRKLELLIKFEDRLFLNPLAKVRNIPKQEEVKIDKNRAMFGD